MSYREEYDNWINSPNLTDDEKAELRSMDDKQAEDAFYKSCDFGTAGMRGIMGLGTNRINKYTVRMAAKAMAAMLLEKNNKEPEESREKKGFFAKLFGKKDEVEAPKLSVVIAYDTRNNSKELALETAGVLSASGIRAMLFKVCAPVPLLSFAIRHLDADGGVVVTASHNTKEYNGFKVYDETGCQLKPELAEIIADKMGKFEDPLSIDASGTYEYVSDSVTEAFQKAISGLGVPGEGFDLEKAASELKVVYTPLHGSGRDYILDALKRGGFCNVSLCDVQGDFNGDFPTVVKPNPEDKEALAIACKQAIKEGADIVIGTDPDCDRIGIAVANEGEFICLSGNQTGALLVDYLSDCRQSADKDGEKPAVITTIVTGELGVITGLLKGSNVIKTLTGFKYIGDIMNEMEAEGKEEHFLLGYEESYGYLPGTHARDKDGVSTALVICRMAAYYKAQGLKLTDVLEKLYSQAGYWLDRQESFVFEGAVGDEKMRSIMARFRVKGAENKGFTDYKQGAEGLPSADVLRFTMDDSSWIAIRPSGTEPKIKVYYCIRGNSKEEAEERQLSISQEINRIMN